MHCSLDQHLLSSASSSRGDSDLERGSPEPPRGRVYVLPPRLGERPCQVRLATWRIARALDLVSRRTPEPVRTTGANRHGAQRRYDVRGRLGRLMKAGRGAGALSRSPRQSRMFVGHPWESVRQGLGPSGQSAHVYFEAKAAFAPVSAGADRGPTSGTQPRRPWPSWPRGRRSGTPPRQWTFRYGIGQESVTGYDCHRRTPDSIVKHARGRTPPQWQIG